MHSYPTTSYFSLGLLLTLGLLAAPELSHAQSAFSDDVNQVLDLQGSEVVHIEVPDELGGLMSVDVPINGATVTLTVVPHSMRDAEFTVKENDGRTETDVDPGQVATFRGQVEGHKGSIVAGGLLEDGLWAQIIFEGGETYWVEPLHGRIDGAAPEEYVVYRQDDILPGGDCGVTASSLTPADPFGATACSGDFCLTQIACDADWQFYLAHSSSTGHTRNRIELIINCVSLQYERDVSISYRITTIMVRTAEPDPYFSFDPGTLLTQFRDEWETNQAGITRDVAHLFTGRDLDGSVVGIAYIGVICSSTSAYGLSQSDFTSNFARASDLTAHELGHNWGANHCTCSSPAFTMNPSITGANRFSTTSDSVSDIVAHRNSRACLSGGLNNDQCDDALVVCAGTYFTNTQNATQDGSTSCGFNANLDAWYVYQPRFSGTATIDTEGSSLTDTVLSVHSESIGTTGNQISCNDDGGTALLSSLTLSVTGGESYLIRVAGYNNTAGSITLNIAGPLCETPANNDCVDAMDICPGEYYGTTQSASNAADASCGSSSSSRDVWFRYVPRSNGWAVFDTCDSEYDTVLGLYSDCSGDVASEIECDDDGGPCGLRSRLEWQVTSGTEYFLRVSGYNNASGTFILGVSGPQCDYDECGAATVVDSGTFYGTLDGASNAGEASCGASVNSADVYYEFTAPYDGTFFATTCGTHDGILAEDSGIDTVLSLHTSCPADVANQITCDDDWPGSLVGCDPADEGTLRDSSVSTPVTQGETIIIRVSHFSSSDPGVFQLNLGVIPENDECADGFDVSAGGTFEGDLTSAQNDGTATCGASANNADVWYYYTATQEGTLQVSTCGTHDMFGQDTGMDTVLSLRIGCPGAFSAQITCNDDWPSSVDSSACDLQDEGVRRDSYVETDVTVGATIRIRVSGYSTSRGPFLLNVAFDPVDGADPLFTRGDCDADGSFNIADVVGLLGVLFPPAGQSPAVLPCRDACDANDDGGLNLADAVVALNALFGVPPVPLPAPGNCGVDPTTDSLDCLMPGCP